MSFKTYEENERTKTITFVKGNNFYIKQQLSMYMQLLV